MSYLKLCIKISSVLLISVANVAYAGHTLESISAEVKRTEGRLLSISGEYTEHEKKFPGFYQYYDLKPSEVSENAHKKVRWAFSFAGPQQRVESALIDPKTQQVLTPLQIDISRPKYNFNGSEVESEGKGAIDGVRVKKSILVCSPVQFSYAVDSMRVSNYISKIEGAEISTSAFNGFECVVIKGRDSVGQTSEVWLAPKHNWIVVKRRQLNIDKDAISIYQVDELAKAGDFWYPKECTFIFAGAKNPDSKYISRTYSVSELKFNKVSDADFNLKLPPGSAINDTSDGKYYKIDKTGREVEKREATSDSKPDIWLTFIIVAFILGVAFSLKGLLRKR